MTDDGLPGCAPPDPDTRTPNLSMPAKACDSHAHVFGPQDVYPFDPGRSYTPPDAPYAVYRHMLDVLGVERACLVQPSVHGTDNTAMLDAIKAADGAFRGIAVIDRETPDAELQRLHDGGVRGLRINLQFDGLDALKGIDKTAERIAPMGWHLQFLANIANFSDVLSDLGKLPVDILFDHLGHMPTGLGIGAQPFQELLAMMRDGRCWAKLSGPYRTTSEHGVPFSDTLPFGQALVAAAPERIVWGTDWPHPHLEIPMVNDGDLVDLLAEWVPDDDARHRILVENPARLFGFAD
ncbi:MAG: amidohydrolase family protein [Proteobacteria bacterium]|nr:amidohydrolase family protein [Pseudomonadota bacterium]